MSADKTITTSNLEYYHNETVKKLNNAVNELNSLVGKVNVPNAIADLSEQIEAASGTANGQQYNSSTNTTTFIKGNSLGSVKVGTLYIQDNSNSKNIVDFVNEKDNSLKSLMRTLDETHVSSQPFNLDKIDNRVQNCIFNAVKNWNLYSDLGTVNEQYTDDTSILPSLNVTVQKFGGDGRGTAWFTHYMQYLETRRIKPIRYDYVVANISHRGNVIYEQCYIIISNTSSDYNKHIYLHLHHHIHGDLVYHSLLTPTQFSEFKNHNYTTLEFKLTERTDAIEQNSELLITSGAVYDGLQEIKDIAAGSGHTYDPEKVSIAEGNSTAIGTHSHAEGSETTAKGDFTHTEGLKTTAIGKNAHAEGGLCLAFANNSHAEGDTTMALGAASHSEGVDSMAIATASHAEGNGTIASEYASHASGEFTNALGKYSFVVGKSKLNKILTFNISEISVENSGNYQRNKIIITIEGLLPIRIIRRGINSNILYLEKSGGSQLIYVSQVTIDISGENMKIIVLTINNYPCSSATETAGFTTGSFGEYAITANGEASFVGGYVDGTNTSKICSVTDNGASSGSIVYGAINSTNARNDNNTIQTSAMASTAMGYINNCNFVKIIGSADGSFARGCITKSFASTIESAGKGSIASGFIGQNSEDTIKTLGEGSISIGCIENATKSTITAEGKGSIASGYISNNNCKIKASGDGSFAQGYVDSEYPNIIANSNGAHAEGIGTQANGLGAHAEGCGTQAFCDYSHAEGYVGRIIPDLPLYPDPISDIKNIKVYDNTVINDRICQFETLPEGVNPDIFKNSTVTLKNKRNVPSEYYPINIENIFAVPDTEYTWYFCVDSRIPLDSDSNNWSMFNGIPSCLGDVAHSEGNCTLASGENSHAEGDYTVASGENSHAESDYTVASGENSHAEGYFTIASSRNSHAEGHSTVAAGDNSHAEGRYSKTDADAAHAEGRYTVAIGENSHAEGVETCANGYAAHAEGIETCANSEGTHAEGVGTYAGGFLYVNTHITASGRYSKNGLLFLNRPISVNFKVNDILVINGKERWVAGVGTVHFIPGTEPYFIEFESPLSDDDVSWAKNNDILLKDIDNNTNGAHAEGCYTKAIGKYSHAEGNGVNHIDDYFKLIEIDNARIDLLRNNGYYYDVANCFWTPDDNVISSGSYSAKLYTDDTFTSFVCDARCTFVDIEDAEGDSILTGGIIRVEDPSKLQLNTEYYQMAITDHAAKGEYSHIEGNNTNAIGIGSHAEGSFTNANGNGSHAEGHVTTANGNGSHAEGFSSVASGLYSHAEGYGSKADGLGSHAEGYQSEAEGQGSHAEGQYTKANGNGSHAGGVGTRAYEGMTAIGRYNSIDSTFYGQDMLFAIGNGENDRNRKNVLNVNKNGNVYFNNNRVQFTTIEDNDYCYIESPTDGRYTTDLEIHADNYLILDAYDGVKIKRCDLVVQPYDVYARKFFSSGSDYAELFEWHDGNKKDEDRTGYFVTITTDGKIKKAKNTDEILGIVSACPGIIGNNPLEWHKKYKRDVFGRLLYDENNNPIINEEYDETQQYIRRSQRKEWSPIGLLGQLIVLDDGSCIAGKKCSVNKNGIATNGDSYLVLQRLDDNHIKILFK